MRRRPRRAPVRADTAGCRRRPRAPREGHGPSVRAPPALRAAPPPLAGGPGAVSSLPVPASAGRTARGTSAAVRGPRRPDERSPGRVVRTRRAIVFDGSRRWSRAWERRCVPFCNLTCAHASQNLQYVRHIAAIPRVALSEEAREVPRSNSPCPSLVQRQPRCVVNTRSFPWRFRRDRQTTPSPLRCTSPSDPSLSTGQ